MQLPPTKTPVSPQDQYQALYDAWTASRSDTPTGAQLLILLAQWALETGWVAGAPASTGQIQWAVGNVKHTAGDGADWTTYLTTEYQGGQPVKVMQDFKAYPDLSSATADYFRRFQPGGPNAGAFAYVQTADPAGFVHALAQERYFTAPESSYLAGLKGRLAALEALNLAPPSSGPSGPAVAGALVLVGLGVGYAVRNGWIDPSRLAHLF